MSKKQSNDPDTKDFVPEPGSLNIGKGGTFIGGSSIINVGGKMVNEGKFRGNSGMQLNITKDFINTGDFKVSDQDRLEFIELLQKSYDETNDHTLRNYLANTLKDAKQGNNSRMKANLRKLAVYIKDHPELIIAPLQVAFTKLT